MPSLAPEPALHAASTAAGDEACNAPALPPATIRRRPTDFVVEELPAYAPSGQGEHVFVRFRKTGQTTMDVVRRMARALGVEASGAGFAGMKDRWAVTTQTASFPFPVGRDPEPLLAAAALADVEILEVTRHGNKLKPGHLSGNRFTVTLRDLPAGSVTLVRGRLADAGRDGVPNAFGPQRFGRDGDNPERALSWLAGRERGPRDRREQRFLVSALQSLLFNRVLSLREADGTWNRVLPGDIAKKSDTGGLFLVPTEGPELDDARARAEAGAISPTGPMFGSKMRWPEAEPRALEERILVEALGGLDRLASRALGEGTRRSLRLSVAELAVEDDPGDSAGIVVRFVLPKGGYATTVLARACRLVDAGAPPETRTEVDSGD